jgi:hypothetical protein
MDQVAKSRWLRVQSVNRVFDSDTYARYDFAISKKDCRLYGRFATSRCKIISFFQASLADCERLGVPLGRIISRGSRERNCSGAHARQSGSYFCEGRASDGRERE